MAAITDVSVPAGILLPFFISFFIMCSRSARGMKKKGPWDEKLKLSIFKWSVRVSLQGWNEDKTSVLCMIMITRSRNINFPTQMELQLF